MRHQARVHAVQALYQSELIESKASEPVDRFLEHSELPEKMRDFTRELGVRPLSPHGSAPARWIFLALNDCRGPAVYACS